MGNSDALTEILASKEASGKKARGEIYGINGPVVTLLGDQGFQMNEMVYVGKNRLVGEVIGLNTEKTTIEVYEETSGMKPGEPVEGTGSPVSCLLAPGILDNIFDGIERPLSSIREKDGAYIERGVSVDSLDREKLWQTHITVKPGDVLEAGAIIAEVPETRAIVHKVMVPPDLSGEVIKAVPDGSYNIETELVTLRLKDGTERALTMCQRWPIRVPRPVLKRYSPTMPLVTGQRILDTLFPIAKGGTAAIPGGFGTGKTMNQHQIAKWSDADIIIYIGCGERGNEMTQVLEEFTKLIDPKSGNPLMDRTTLIANTSNMPVAAREGGHHGGLHLPLGGGSERALRTSGGDACRGGLSRLPGFQTGSLLRESRTGGEPERVRGIHFHHRSSLPPGRRFLRARDPEHQAFRPLLLGSGQVPGLCETLSRHPVAQLLLRLCGRPGRLVYG